MKMTPFLLSMLVSHTVLAEGPQVHYCFGENLTAKLIVVDVGVIGGEIVEDRETTHRFDGESISKFESISVINVGTNTFITDKKNEPVLVLNNIGRLVVVLLRRLRPWQR